MKGASTLLILFSVFFPLSAENKEPDYLSFMVGVGRPFSPLIDRENSVADTAGYYVWDAAGNTHFFSRSVMSVQVGLEFERNWSPPWSWTIQLMNNSVHHRTSSSLEGTTGRSSFGGALLQTTSLSFGAAHTVPFYGNFAWKNFLSAGYGAGVYEVLKIHREIAAGNVNNTGSLPDLSAENSFSQGPVASFRTGLYWFTENRFRVGLSAAAGFQWLLLSSNPWKDLSSTQSLSDLSGRAEFAIPF